MAVKRLPGNTMAEYALIGTLLAGVCIAALMQLGGNLNTNIDGFQSSLAYKPYGGTPVPGGAPAPGSNPAGGPSSPTSGVPGNLGDLLNKSTFQGVQEAIMVSGANGATDQLASTMKAYVEQLLAEGKLTDDQASILTRLANEGHALAGAEKLLEDATLNGSSTVNYNGQTYSVTDFTEMFGVDPGKGIAATAKNMSAADAKALSAPFVDLYTQAKASGALSDPAVASVIDSLSGQIYVMSDQAKWNAKGVANGSIPKENYFQDMSYGYVTAMEQTGVSNLPPGAISSATHGNSSQICSTGAGSDSGTNCAQ